MYDILKVLTYRSRKPYDLVALAFRDFQISGRATYIPRPMNEWEQKSRDERMKLNAQFPKERHRKNVTIDKATLIARYHRIYLAGQYPFGVPSHLLTGIKVVNILKNGAKG